MGQEHNINTFLADIAARNPEDRENKFLTSTNTLLPKGVAGPVLPGQAGFYDAMREIQAASEGDWFPGHGFADKEAGLSVNRDLHAPIDGPPGSTDPRYGDVNETPDYSSPEYTYSKGQEAGHEHYMKMREMANLGMLTPETRKIVNISPLLLTHPEAKSRRQLEAEG